MAYRSVCFIVLHLAILLTDSGGRCESWSESLEGSSQVASKARQTKFVGPHTPSAMSVATRSKMQQPLSAMEQVQEDHWQVVSQTSEDTPTSYSPDEPHLQIQRKYLYKRTKSYSHSVGRDRSTNNGNVKKYSKLYWTRKPKEKINERKLTYLLHHGDTKSRDKYFNGIKLDASVSNVDNIPDTFHRTLIRHSNRNKNAKINFSSHKGHGILLRSTPNTLSKHKDAENIQFHPKIDRILHKYSQMHIPVLKGSTEQKINTKIKTLTTKARVGEKNDLETNEIQLGIDVNKRKPILNKVSALSSTQRKEDSAVNFAVQWKDKYSRKKDYFRTGVKRREGITLDSGRRFTSSRYEKTAQEDNSIFHDDVRIHKVKRGPLEQKYPAMTDAMNFKGWRRKLLQVSPQDYRAVTPVQGNKNDTQVEFVAPPSKEIQTSPMPKKLYLNKNNTNNNNEKILSELPNKENSEEDDENENLNMPLQNSSNSTHMPETNNVSAINHLNLDLLEEELAKKESSQRDLLFAISILQHHSMPSVSTSASLEAHDETSIDQSDLRNELMHSNEESLELDTFGITVRTGPKKDGSSEIFNFQGGKQSFEDTYEPVLPETMFIDREINPIPYFDSNIPNRTNHVPIGVDLREESFKLPNENGDYFSNDVTIFSSNVDQLTISQNKDNSSKNEFSIANKNAHHHLNSNIMKDETVKWIILVMDGDCGIISKRMNTFVMFLKAALSTRLEVNYDDIYVMSVFCDSTFMVNISLSADLYDKTLLQLQTLADANTTLLEISGEIFYLEKIVTLKNKNLLGRLQGDEPTEDIEMVLYIAVGCVCTFILISVFIVTLISICRKEPDEDLDSKSSSLDKSDFPIRKPNVIYSHKFTQELNPEKYRLTPFEDHSSGGVAPSDSVSFESNKYISERVDVHTNERYQHQQERRSFMNPSSSKIQLLEEVQEEDEDEIEDGAVLEGDEDYHEEEEEVEDIDDEDDDFIIENMALQAGQQQGHHSTLVRSAESNSDNTSVLATGHSHHSCCTKTGIPSSFDNPCYNR